MGLTSLKQQIEKNSVFMYPDKTAYMMNETVQVISTDYVLGLLADYLIISKKTLELECVSEGFLKWLVGIDEMDGTPKDLTKYICIPRKQLEEKYGWWKAHTELDKASGYVVTEERKELLKVFKELLEESK